MANDRLIDARFLNSVTNGLADVLFKWDGAVWIGLGAHVGKDLVEELENIFNFEDSAKEEIINELFDRIIINYQIADSITFNEDEEKECVELMVDNCVLLPFARREIERNPWFRQAPFCPIKNMVMDILERKGINSEIRNYMLSEDRCHLVIGLVEELPMEKELREMKSG